MLQILKTKTKRIASTLAAGVLLFSQLAGVQVVSAASTQKNQISDWCTISETSGGVKFEGSGEKPNDNVVDDTIDGITATYSPTGDNSVEKESVTVTTDGTKDVTLVVVKGGNDEDGGNAEYYGPSFTDLTAPINPNNDKPFGISHVIVCYDEDEPEEFGSVKVSKKVDNGYGIYVDSNGDESPFRWGLDAEATDNFMGSTQANVAVGLHAVTENSVNGYEFVGWYYAFGDEDYNWRKSCDNPRSTSLPTDIEVKQDETRKIVLCNKVKKGSITIVKDAQPNSNKDFDFNINQKGIIGLYDNFELEDDGNEYDGHKSSKTFENLKADEYVVTELGEDGWVLTDITCSEGSDVTVNKDSGKVTINLAAGDSVTCTFTNQKKGLIKVFKHTDPAGDQTKFDIEATTEDGAIYSDPTRKIADGQSRSFSVGFGTYNVNETLPEGWVQTDNDCEDIVINAETLYAECHIYNAKERNVINGYKFNDVNGNGVWDDNELALANWTITLTKECEEEKDEEIVLLFNRVQTGENEEDCEPVELETVTDQNGAYSFANLEPGTYTVCELQKSNWTQTYPKDNDGCHKVVFEGYGETKDDVNFGNKAKPQVLGDQVTTLAVTGATNGTKGMLVGLSILGALGALHILVTRRKDYVK